MTVVACVLVVLVTVMALAWGRGREVSPPPGGSTTAESDDQDRSTPSESGENVADDPMTWVYQLQGYHGSLQQVADAHSDYVVIDLARDAGDHYWTRAEVADVQANGSLVLAYVEIGALEDYRPEAAAIHEHASDLVLNVWPDWPEEHFVAYWDERWWDLVLAPRIDQALAAGFDGIYLDTPLAYEEIELTLVPGVSRSALAQRMGALIVRISEYAKAAQPDFLIVPQNSPELRLQRGYLEAVDGIGMEELFVLATDEECTADWCAENLAHTRALRDAGKFVLAVDYADDPALAQLTRQRYADEGFYGYVGPVALDTVRAVDE